MTAKIVKFPGVYYHSPVVNPKEMWSQEDPSDLMVWEICPYLNNNEKCYGCPEFDMDPEHGAVKSGCRMWAEEACRTIFAVQKREEE